LSSTWPPNVCAHCDAEVDDFDAICPRCGHDQFVAGPSKRREAIHTEAVRSASTESWNAVRIVGIVFLVFAGAYWVPMLQVATPWWALCAEPVLILVMAFACATEPISAYSRIVNSIEYSGVAPEEPGPAGSARGWRRATWITSVVAWALMVFSSEWKDASWVSPAVAAATCGAFGVILLVQHAYWVFGGGTSEK
jgi:hypothetical protein